MIPGRKKYHLQNKSITINDWRETEVLKTKRKKKKKKKTLYIKSILNESK